MRKFHAHQDHLKTAKTAAEARNRKSSASKNPSRFANSAQHSKFYSQTPADSVKSVGSMVDYHAHMSQYLKDASHSNILAATRNTKESDRVKSEPAQFLNPAGQKGNSRDTTKAFDDGEALGQEGKGEKKGKFTELFKHSDASVLAGLSNFQQGDSLETNVLFDVERDSLCSPGKPLKSAGTSSLPRGSPLDDDKVFVVSVDVDDDDDDESLNTPVLDKFPKPPSPTLARPEHERTQRVYPTTRSQAGDSLNLLQETDYFTLWTAEQESLMRRKLRKSKRGKRKHENIAEKAERESEQGEWASLHEEMVEVEL